jgi:hypothetical protein
MDALSRGATGFAGQLELSVQQITTHCMSGAGAEHKASGSSGAVQKASAPSSTASGVRVVPMSAADVPKQPSAMAVCQALAYRGTLRP